MEDRGPQICFDLHRFAYATPVEVDVEALEMSSLWSPPKTPETLGRGRRRFQEEEEKGNSREGESAVREADIVFACPSSWLVPSVASYFCILYTLNLALYLLKALAFPNPG
ncbi:hypothetical protein K1719_041193 [Acacia pycnantha]|nr:hypothetical protein K1719_041193 [Acacia pycnantha]